MKLTEVKKLYEPFLNGIPSHIEGGNYIEGESSYFNITYIEFVENPPSLYQQFYGIKELSNDLSCFKAEYNFAFGRTNFIIGNYFKLDFTQIEIELNRISNADSRLKKKLGSIQKGIGLLDPFNIAFILSINYPNSCLFLEGFNKLRDNYVEIAKLLINSRGIISGKKFNF